MLTSSPIAKIGSVGKAASISRALKRRRQRQQRYGKAAGKSCHATQYVPPSTKPAHNSEPKRGCAPQQYNVPTIYTGRHTALALCGRYIHECRA